MDDSRGASDAAYLRSVVPVMRELGVVQFRLLTLGPPPPKAAVIAIAAEDSTDPVVRERLNKELAEELRRERVERARADMRMQLAHTGVDYTDTQIDVFVGVVE